MFYKTLKVHREAIPDEIKASYHKLALKFHPDKPGGSLEDFQKIQKAYEILIDAQKRAEYDEMMTKKRERLRNFNRPEPFTCVIGPVGYKLADYNFYIFETSPQKVRCGLQYGDIVEFQGSQGCFVGLSADSFLYWCKDGHDYATPLCHAASDFALSSIRILQRSNLDGGKVHVAPTSTRCKNQKKTMPTFEDPASGGAIKKQSSAPAGGPNRKSKASQIWEQLRHKEKIKMINQYLRDTILDEIDERKALEALYFKQLEQMESEMALALRLLLLSDVPEAPEEWEESGYEAPSSHSAEPSPPSALGNPEKDEITLQGGIKFHSDPLSSVPTLNKRSESHLFSSILRSNEGVMQSTLFSLHNGVDSPSRILPQRRGSLSNEQPHPEEFFESAAISSGGATILRPIFINNGNNDTNNDAEGQESLVNITRSLRLSLAPTETDCGSIISNEGINGTQRNDESEEEDSMFQIHVVSEAPCQESLESLEKNISDMFETYNSKNGETMNTMSLPGASMDPSIRSFPSEPVFAMTSPLTASIMEPLRNAASPRSALLCDSERSSSTNSGKTALYLEKTDPVLLKESQLRRCLNPERAEVNMYNNLNADFTTNEINTAETGRLADQSTPRPPKAVFPKTTTEETGMDTSKGTTQNGLKGKIGSKKPSQGLRKAAAKKPLSFVKIDADGVLRIPELENLRKRAVRAKSFDHLTAEELFEQEMGFIEEFMNQGKVSKRSG